MTVYIIYATVPNSGYIESSSAVAATALSGANLIATSNNTASWGWEFESATYYVEQQFWEFDTSSVVGTVSVATLNFYTSNVIGSGATDNPTFEMRTYDYGSSLTTADYRTNVTYNALTKLATINQSGLTTGNRYDMTSEAAFLSAINQAGNTRMVGVTDTFAAATTPTANYYINMDLTGGDPTTTSPRLTITAAVAVAGFMQMRGGPFG